MDIREPLSKLKFLLEQRLNINLSDYGFCLQDAQALESHKNLVDQCVQGEGLVQINVQLKVDSKGEKKINIVDVLKPTEEYVEIGNDNEDEPESGISPVSNDQDRVVRWVVDTNFKKDQIRLNIPEDPMEWEIAHVRHWLLWAVRQFNLVGIKLNDWMITGAELCNMSLKMFHSKVPNDPGNAFWTHLELLRKCKIVGGF
ncbi:hypothetical protein AAG570_004222 [Ranatra chinensis]|uniref:PNT domain-containing protein n=1 Tax=Ranatra chinensis TaxID=642074 RepID=A0ABD0Y383_9HEMI